MEGQMARILAVLFVLMFAFAAFGASAVDTATATCKDYENGSHQDMVDIVAAFQQALKADPKFRSLSESELDSVIDKICITHLDAKVIDALGVKK
jgi:ABC-type transporter MlaC component